MRMIVVNRACGYIFADKIASTPMRAIEKMDKSFGHIGYTYYQTHMHDNNVLYDVYQVEDFPLVYDGTDQNLIETLERSGKHIASIAMEEA